MRYQKWIPLVLILGLNLLVINGCKQSVSTNPGSGVRPFFMYSGGSGVDISTIIGTYDTSNLVGLIHLYKINKTTLEHLTGSSLTNYDGTDAYGDAFSCDSTGAPGDIQDFTVNAGSFSHIDLGTYSYAGHDLDIYTNGSTWNKLRVVGWAGTFYGHGLDSVKFGAAPAITNISRGQNISRDSTITVSWSGTSTGFVQLGIRVRDADTVADTLGKGYWVGGLFNNSGNQTLTFTPQQLHLGVADVELSKFDPKFITLSSGKRVCVLCETRHYVTVHIVD